MINLNAGISGSLQKLNTDSTSIKGVKEAAEQKSDFADTVKAVEKYLSKVDDLQQDSNMSIKDLLTRKNEDITSVISAMAKADMSFKLLVGVRNKLIEAYKQTMQMPL